jgi:hypothetical protein
MHFIPEQLTLHLTSIFKGKDDPSPEWFHVTSTRPNRGIGPNRLNVPFNPINPSYSIKEAKQLAAKMLGVDYTAIELVHYLKHYVADAEASAPLVGSSA